MVSLVNSHTNTTRIGLHLWGVDLRFSPGLPPGWRGFTFEKRLESRRSSMPLPPAWRLCDSISCGQEFSIEEQLLRRNVNRFRGGLVFKAHRLVYYSTLGLRVIKEKKREEKRNGQGVHRQIMSVRQGVYRQIVLCPEKCGRKGWTYLARI